MLVVSLGKPVIHKLKILAGGGGGGDWNILNQRREPQKGRGGGQILKFQLEESWKKL